jgi:hypothetical protein
MSGQTCCADDVVAEFQNKANTLIETINNYAAAKDLYLAQLNNAYLASFNGMLQNISDNNQDDLNNIQQLSPTVANAIQAIIDNATQAANDANVNSNFGTNLAIYQKLRTTCFDTAFEVQTSAWCLACDPNYATEGVAADNTITFSDGLCQAISDACYPYLNQTGIFNPLFTVRQWYWDLLSVTNYLKNYTTDGALHAFNILQDLHNPLGSQHNFTVPPLWTGNGNDAGPAQCQDLWANDPLLSKLLTIGAGDAAIGADGTWTPDLTGAGLDFGNLVTDPGDYFGVA